jgi:NAD(P)-dependent dehydrogenase (short-subunit alcohol dehydrogenase family)
LSYALITGSAKRIGSHIVLFLAKNGWDIIIHYNSSETEALKLQNDVIALGRKCLVYQEDFSQVKDVEKIVNKVPISLLINNAAIFKNDNLNSMKEDEFFNSFKVNFLTPVLLSKFILRKNFVEQQINVINILDSIVYKLPKNFASYYFTKMALANFTKLAAKLYAPACRVNGIALGQIMRCPAQAEETFQKNKEETPMGYSGSLDELCLAVDFIINARSLTGQIITLDGGAHLDNTTYP